MNPTNPEQVPAKKSWKRPGIIWPIVLMAWPAMSIVVAIILYAIVALVFSTTQQPTGGEANLFADEPASPVRTILNVFLFILGAGAVAFGPISFIVGLILLIINLNKK